MAFKFNPFTGNLDNIGPEVTALNTLGVKADLATIQAIVGPSVGDVWQADDTDIFYLWDGSAWVSLGTLGGPTGPTGPTGPAGADGSTILSGSGAPVDNVTGSDGDFYIDTAAHTIYGPRTAGAWGVGTSLVAGGATTLGGLTDVDLATTPPTDGQALVYDNASGDWIPGSAGATAAGSANEIQYNDGASGLAASADLTWDDTSKQLTVGGDMSMDSGGAFTTTVQAVTPTANRTISFPDQTGTVGLVSGATGNIQYNNAGQLAGTGDFNVDLNWTDPLVTYTGLKVNVTDTGSALGSNVLDLQVNGTSAVRYTPSETSLGGGAGQAIYTPLVRVREYFGSAFIYNGANVSNGLKIGQGTTGFLDITASDVGVQFRLVNGSAWLTTDGAYTFAQRRGTNAQTYRLYDTYTSATDYHRLAIATARATLTGVSGASVTATGLIPAGAVVMGVTSKVTTALGTVTGYQIGTGADADRWGNITGTAAGTTSDNRDWTAGTIECFPSATDVIVTAVGGNFDGTGDIYLSVQYMTGQSD